MEITTESELLSVAEGVLASLESADQTHANVIALHGDLGAGKTAFVKALGSALRVHEDITSPTFVILKIYECGEGASFEHLAHIDAYRVESEDEMRPLRFEELLAQGKTLVCIEWAEKIASLLPPSTIHIGIEIKDEKRIITIS